MTNTQLYQCPANAYDRESRRCIVDSARCMNSETDGRLNPNATRCLFAKQLLSITGELKKAS